MLIEFFRSVIAAGDTISVERENILTGIAICEEREATPIRFFADTHL